MYGGRAIDSFDRRILTTYMDEYLGDFIFDTFQPFHFFRNKEVDYKIPAGDVKEKFVGEIPRRSRSGWKAVSEGDRRRRDSSPRLSATPLVAQPWSSGPSWWGGFSSPVLGHWPTSQTLPGRAEWCPGCSLSHFPKRDTPTRMG